MLLTHASSRLSLHIAGYQFPQATGIDAEWLIVEAEIHHPRGHWSFRDPCLMVEDVRRLADWLEEIARDDESDDSCDFTEPNIAFDLLVGASQALRVSFRAESGPPWAAPGEGASLVFPLQSLQLTSLARTLREELDELPPRNPAGDFRTQDR